MPHVNSPSSKRPANYSNCPLKKRPIKYEPEDEDSDTDLSRSGPTSPSTSLEDMAEPENLSTKPEDLRMSTKPPSVSVVAGRVVSASSVSPPSTDFKPYLQSSPISSSSDVVSFSPSSLPAPPPLKPSLGPLEPISLNNRVWSNTRGPMVADRHLSIPVPSLRAHHRESISPVAASYPREGAATFHYYPYQNRHGSSPPHISPPIASEQSYPPVLNLKQEQIYSVARSKGWSPHHHHGVTHSPPPTHHQMDVHQHYRVIEEVPRNYNGGYTTVKTEQMCYPSPAHSQGSSGSRDSVISHSSRSSTASSGSHSPIVPTNVNGSVRYQCPDCNKSYSTFSGLSKHLQFHCASQNKKQFMCKYCDKVYVSLGALKMHIRTHTLPCKCNICGKAFSRPWLLQGHIRTHTGEKPFSCQHCNRAFADRSNLRAHLQTHSEVKKYSCKTCAKTFSRMSLLLKHEDNGCSSSPLTC